jgi:hypothetical protein
MIHGMDRLDNRGDRYYLLDNKADYVCQNQVSMSTDE